MVIRPIHPFPARMAPEIAISQLRDVRKGSVILDPMMGSGTVIRHAVELGHRAIGVDMDPLAVLMSRVWSAPLEDRILEQASDVILGSLPLIAKEGVSLPWIDGDPETAAFVKFWFGEKQIRHLRALAFAVSEFGLHVDSQIADVFRVALSRIIVTKNAGASLANDVSHSRPHRVMTSSESDYDIVAGFRRSLKQVRTRLASTPKTARATTYLGDARTLTALRRNSADIVLTSPPYLNAIDYMRGHKLSLVWLGHSISSLRTIRSSTIGTERKADGQINAAARKVQKAMVDLEKLDGRHSSIVERYAGDLVRMMAEIGRTLKPDGKAILVVGNSCLKQTFVKNSSGVVEAASASGLCLKSEQIRELPPANRYLPTPKDSDSALGKRMRTESVLTFIHAA